METIKSNNQMIIGLGGFGSNILNHINLNENNPFELVFIDYQDVLNFECKAFKNSCNIENKIYINNNMIENIKRLAIEKDEIIILSGLGRVSSRFLKIIIDEFIKENKKLNVVCMKPFKFENEKKIRLSNNLLDELKSMEIKLKIYDNDMNNYKINKSMSKCFEIYNDIIYRDILDNSMD